MNIAIQLPYQWEHCFTNPYERDPIWVFNLLMSNNVYIYASHIEDASGNSAFYLFIYVAYFFYALATSYNFTLYF